MSKGVVVVVLGYRTPNGALTHGLCSYLDKAIRFVRENPTKAIVVSGGHTAKSAPHKSEAGTIKEYLSENYVGVDIYTDEEARTTAENLENVKKILKNNHLDSTEIVIFCDHCRKWKVKSMGKIILGFYPRTETYDLTKNFIEKMRQVFVATPLNILSIFVPFLKEMELKRKYRLAKNN